MNTVIELMLAVRDSCPVFYHKDTNQFDYWPISEIERETLDPNARIPYKNLNNFRLPSYEKIDHEEIMRFYVKEFVEDKAVRKQLFDILRQDEYMELYLDKLRELDLYDDFIDACGDVYIQIFEEWAQETGLDFRIR